MTVSDPDRLPPAVARLTNATLDTITLTTEEVMRQLQLVDPKKALGPDGVSPHILKHCAAQLAAPVTDIFQRDVAGLCVTYKILKQGAPHLAILRQPWATPHPYSTRDANKRDQQLIVPFARTATFFRSFLPRYSRLWNRVVRQTDMHQAATLHIFKCAVNAWLMPSGHN
ncbi:hypothetical protein GWK47_008925 [Chionoecetes opilio]|uniref:Uncharacterized protein n=1 Tax=Chionoecetes opilio TaxID=41210 RepID=A0A8J5CR41_CHIOP|nr:hypothetical protein GWK47_008925 [Chionoecetes opilio]